MISNHLRFFASFALAGALVGALSFIAPRSAPAAILTSASVGAGAEEASTPSPFGALVLTARAAAVLDTATGETLFEKQSDAQLPLASLMKIMTVETALAAAPRYALVPVLPEFLETEGDSGLVSEESWTLKDLLSFTLVASSNDGATAAAAIGGSFLSQSGARAESREAFIAAMNREAAERGLGSMYFLNETGLDETGEIAGGYGSARDIGRLIASAYRAHPELFDATALSSALFTEENGNRHSANNTNTAAAAIPLLRASKTGTTDLAGGNLAVVFDAGVGKPIAIAVLGSTEEGRFADVQALVAATLKYLQRNDSLPL